uniref:Uncharacterized protein n=1 Tax=Salix viminalis TaxID=40686 RepID=A0A6N2MQG2_SALVM
MVINVEKSQPSDGAAQDDQESVHELENLREIENMRPEEERPFRRGVHGVANDVVHTGCVVNDGEAQPVAMVKERERRRMLCMAVRNLRVRGPTEGGWHVRG